MNKIGFYLLVIILSFTYMNGYAQADNKQKDVFLHTVERGQTVYSIAAMYGVNQDDIYRLNPESKNTIKIGEKLKIPQKAKKGDNTNNTDEYTYHTIQPGETLYSLSIKYDVPADAIINANPGLSTATFTSGKIIRIPHILAEEKIIEQVKTVLRDTKYIVKSKDTFYSIGRRFDISEAQLIKRNPSLKNGLKAGMEIFIPEKFDIVVNTIEETPSESDVNALLNQRNEPQQIKVIKAALLLPFTDKENQSRSQLYVEYYEGLLLAVDSLKNGGYSIELSVFDTGNGTQKLKDILKDESLKHVNLIIGGVDEKQINLLSRFCQDNRIKYVNPFSKSDDVLSNAELFQINTPHSYLYAKTSQAFTNLFGNYNIILLDFSGDKEEKKDFIQALKLEMEQKQIPFKEIKYTDEFSLEMESHLSTEKMNVIVPTSASTEALSKILSPLRLLTENKPEYILSLFGYPEWQTYTMDFLEDFYALDTYIYSYFYADNLSREVNDFYQKYKSWYSKNLIYTFPKFGMLGFDTAFFFFTALHNYGENFENNISKVNYQNIQTGFNFERVNNWGGFINTNLFIIHYRKDFTVTKTELNHP